MESEGRLLDSIFNPRAVAIIGASPQDLATLAQMSTKIRDRLFLVNPKYTEVRGKKCYPSLSNDQEDFFEKKFRSIRTWMQR
jgi:acyl-CoA synthetase (NDP forming)